MKLDIKKEDKIYYTNKITPEVVIIEKHAYITFNGYGDPNDTNSNFKYGIELLYSTAYTLSMSYKSEYKIKNFKNFVVQPLEGYWYQEGIDGYDPTKKDLFKFKLLIRMPDFITIEDFNWAIKTIEKKKNKSYNEVNYEIIDEGLCVQCLHIGSFDSEHLTTQIMHNYLKGLNYELDFNDHRMHHEIYISDYRKTQIDKLKTILRHPIKKGEIL